MGVEMKKVSVIVPCYNCESYIDYCIQPLVHQTMGLENLEVILINDASTDKSILKLAEYEQLYPDNIILIPLVENMMQGGARNIGLQYATGEYIVFLDSDDYFMECALERLYQAAIEQDADIVEFTGHNVTEEERGKENKKFEADKPKELEILDSIEKRKEFIISGKSPLGCCFKFYKGDFIRKYQFRFAEHVAFEEPPFIYPMRFFEKKHYFLNEHLYYAYENPRSTMRYICRKAERKWDNLNASLEALNQIQRFQEADNYKEEIEFFFLDNYFVLSMFVLVSRGFFVDLVTLRRMQKTVKEYFPEYQKNPYLQRPEFILDKQILKCVELSIDEDTIEEFNRQVISIFEILQ